MLGTSDAWSTSRLSHRPSELAYYIVDCRILSTSSHSRLLGSIKNIGLLQSNEFQKGKKLRAEYCNRHSIYPVKIILNGIENKMSLNGKTTYGHNLGH